MAKVLHLAVGFAALSALAACADDLVPPGPAHHVRITGGNQQSGIALDTLALPLEVTVVDDAGEPVAGRTVSWASPDQTGELLPFARTTDANGRARAIWILGLDSGEHTASAIVAGEDGAVEFTATASPVVGFKAIALMQGVRPPSGIVTCALSQPTAWRGVGAAMGSGNWGTARRQPQPHR